MKEPPRKLRIGIALGGGSARGWAHIGVLQALRERGIEPDVVCGTSIGALVGAAYVSGYLEKLEHWCKRLQWHHVVSYLDLTLSGGLIKGNRLFDFLQSHFEDRAIEALSRPFAAVATDLETGLEIWLREGSVLNAVRASSALPGIFTPVRYDDRWLVDGGLVNPVPVSLCRALGAEIVIAVDLNADLLERHPLRAAKDIEGQVAEAAESGERNGLLRQPARYLRTMLFGESSDLPSIFDVIGRSINIMQIRITRSRMAGDPPDIRITPQLAHIALLEFHRAEEAIAEGRRAVERASPQLAHGARLLDPTRAETR
ncbi:MAG: patatin-like phospholipase RssA [Gammaproteobacteria bacterium]